MTEGGDFYLAKTGDLELALDSLRVMPSQFDSRLIHALSAEVFDGAGRMSGQAAERCEYTVYPGVSPSREIVAAISLLNATLDRGWQIADLASAAALSSSQLTRLFRTQIGVSAAALLRQLRAGSRNHKT